MNEGINHTPDKRAQIEEFKNQALNLPKEQLRNLYNDIAQFGRFVEAEYPECGDYELFHFLIGSTVQPDKIYIKEDFPGDYAIGSFISKMKEKYHI